MKRTTIFLPADLDRRLQAYVRRAEKPMAVVVREAIAAHLSASQAPAGLPAFVGKYDSGRTDIASRLDEFVFRDLRPHGEPAAPRTRRKR